MFFKISQNSQENACARVSFLTKLLASLHFIKKDTLAQVFSCEFCETDKNAFFTEHLWATALEKWNENSKFKLNFKFISKLYQQFYFIIIEGLKTLFSPQVSISQIKCKFEDI